MYSIFDPGPNSVLPDIGPFPDFEMTASMTAIRVANMARSLRLPRLADDLARSAGNPDEMDEETLRALDDLFTRELDRRESDWFLRNLRKANLKYPEAALDERFRDPERKLNTFLIEMLRCPTWVHDKENVVVVGTPGAGKTFLACALGSYALAQGLTVYYTTVSSMLFEMDREARRADLLTAMEKYASPALLILDDFGLIPTSSRLTPRLFDVLAERADSKSTMIVSSHFVKEWAALFPDCPFAEEILRRVTGRAHFVYMPGPVMRKTAPPIDEETPCEPF